MGKVWEVGFIRDYTEKRSWRKTIICRILRTSGTNEPRVSPLISKPEACKPLAGGRVPATPPASDPTDPMHTAGVPEADIIARRRFRRNSWKCWKRPGSNMTLAIWTDVIALMRVQLRPFQGRNLSPDSYRWWSVCAPPPANCLQASGLRTKGVALDIPLAIVLALVVEGRNRGRRRSRELRIYMTV